MKIKTKIPKIKIIKIQTLLINKQKFKMRTSLRMMNNLKIHQKMNLKNFNNNKKQLFSLNHIDLMIKKS